MSTAAATAAGAAAPNAGAATPPATPPAEEKKIATVPDDIRRRVLGMRTPPETPEAKAAREAAEKTAAEKKAGDDAAAKKKQEDDARAAANPEVGSAPAGKVRKVKSGPPLPEKKNAPTDTRTVEQVVREVLPEITKEKVAPSVTVDPEVQREIDLAEFAEKKNGERYAGMAAKVKTFFASHDELVAAKAKELGGAKSADFKDYLESDEYKNWVAQNRPSYARGDKAKLAEDMIADRARAEAEREMQPKLKQLERQTAELKHAPVIKAKTDAALRVIITDPNAEKDPALEGFSKDPVKFGEEHPEEAKIIAQEATVAVDMIEEVYKIDLDLVDFNPKSPTEKQAQIRQFVRGRNLEMRDKYPNGMEMADGKILVDADTYAERGLANDPRYRVFNADEIAGMLAATHNAAVLARLQQRREGIKKSVYAPKQETPPAAPPDQKTETEDDPPAPAAGSRPAPGTGGKPKEQKSLASRYA